MIAMLVTMSSNDSVIEYIRSNAHGKKNEWTDYDLWVSVREFDVNIIRMIWSRDI